MEGTPQKSSSDVIEIRASAKKTVPIESGRHKPVRNELADAIRKISSKQTTEISHSPSTNVSSDKKTDKKIVSFANTGPKNSQFRNVTFNMSVDPVIRKIFTKEFDAFDDDELNRGIPSTTVQNSILKKATRDMEVRCPIPNRINYSTQYGLGAGEKRMHNTFPGSEPSNVRKEQQQSNRNYKDEESASSKNGQTKESKNDGHWDTLEDSKQVVEARNDKKNPYEKDQSKEKNIQDAKLSKTESVGGLLGEEEQLVKYYEKDKELVANETEIQDLSENDRKLPRAALEKNHTKEIFERKKQVIIRLEMSKETIPNTEEYDMIASQTARQEDYSGKKRSEGSVRSEGNEESEENEGGKSSEQGISDYKSPDTNTQNKTTSDKELAESSSSVESLVESQKTQQCEALLRKLARDKQSPPQNSIQISGYEEKEQEYATENGKQLATDGGSPKNFTENEISKYDSKDSGTIQMKEDLDEQSELKPLGLDQLSERKNLKKNTVESTVDENSESSSTEDFLSARECDSRELDHSGMSSTP